MMMIPLFDRPSSSSSSLMLDGKLQPYNVEGYVCTHSVQRGISHGCPIFQAESESFRSHTAHMVAAAAADPLNFWGFGADMWIFFGAGSDASMHQTKRRAYVGPHPIWIALVLECKLLINHSSGRGGCGGRKAPGFRITTNGFSARTIKWHRGNWRRRRRVCDEKITWGGKLSEHLLSSSQVGTYSVFGRRRDQSMCHVTDRLREQMGDNLSRNIWRSYFSIPNTVL